MKKNLFYRCLFGAPTGLAISYAITIIISLFIGDGRFHAACRTTALCGSGSNAVLLQSVCSLSMAYMGRLSVVWEKKTGVCCVNNNPPNHWLHCNLPIPYLLRWMEHSLLGISLYFALFLPYIL
ncbi:MAG: DUF3021 family protein [Eisenbergiella sp.]